ncbi:MAG: hypothetical protein KatS3mg029_0650 [Saprospiraceae bacterium]|nr:MAG: hypothetical protein KatS3mg029_0650 [Saprospiraceae bacterium]
MRRISKYLFLLIAASWLATLPADGQTMLQVVTKTVEKTFPYKNGYELNIEGEKAEILVQTWNRSEVRVLLEIVAKHPERRIAENDIDRMSYSTEQHGNKIYFRNYLEKNLTNSQPASDIKAIYTITLPADCPVYLKNNFGLTSVSDLTRALRINSEFSKINLQNIRGKVGITSRFGDIEGERIGGEVSLVTRRSDVTLHDIEGTWNIQAQYGVLKFFTNTSPELLNLNIEADKADVYFFDPKPNFYGYTLTAHYGNITVPRELKFNYLENTNQLKKAIFSSSIGSSNISIKISFGDIVIRSP